MAYLKTLLIFYPYSEALRCLPCLCHLNVTGKKKKKWTDRLNLVISVSAHRIPCLPLQKFIINCISKSGSQPLLSAIIFKVTRVTVHNRGGHDHGGTACRDSWQQLHLPLGHGMRQVVVMTGDTKSLSAVPLW